MLQRLIIDKKLGKNSTFIKKVKNVKNRPFSYLLLIIDYLLFLLVFISVICVNQRLRNEFGI
jgi:hypothetical protein